MAEAQEKLRPVDKREFAGQLGACLSLVAPSGMAADERTEWLRAAWITMEGIPADLLSRGCDVARRYCDHPSKVVPMIMREIETIWQQRKNNRSAVTAAIAKMSDPEDDEPRCTPEQAAEILSTLSNLKFQPDKPVRAFNTPPEKPTREDYIRWGVDPDALETSENQATSNTSNPLESGEKAA